MGRGAIVNMNNGSFGVGRNLVPYTFFLMWISSSLGGFHGDALTTQTTIHSPAMRLKIANINQRVRPPVTFSRYVTYLMAQKKIENESWGSIRKVTPGPMFGNEKNSNSSSSSAQWMHSDVQSQPRSRSLTPNNILEPLYFSYNSDERNGGLEKGNLRHDEKDLSEDAIHNPLSFPLALQKMTETLNAIVNYPRTEDLTMMLGGGELFVDRANISGTINGDIELELATPFTIQIVQKVNHQIDALCWIHKNQHRISSIYGRKKSHGNDDGDIYPPPTFYFSNVENTFEAASIGSALSITDLDYGQNWQIIQSLPKNSGVYGARRFDQHGKISAEWRDFGRELWMLPAIELRREKEIAEDVDSGKNSSDGDSSDESMRGGNNINLMVHLHFTSLDSLLKKARYTLRILQSLSSSVSAAVPCVTLPPVLSREYNPDAQEVFERGVNAALAQFEDRKNETANENVLQKVVLARRSDLNFATEKDGLDVMMKLKFGGSFGGHLFYMNPGGGGNEFLGCSPERLFQVRGEDRMVISEALAGTRPRGTTSEADAQLLRDLMSSEKDRSENIITGQFIKAAFQSLRERGLLEKDDEETKDDNEVFFVRRLRHLQHICQSFEGKMKKSNSPVDIAQFMLDNLHPTPAVCGVPKIQSMQFIRDNESISFDRGMYAGPLGFLGSNSADIIVAIRSALLSKNIENQIELMDSSIKSSLSIYAGAGIVPGSTVQGEWSETGYKLGVLSSAFSPTPLTLKSFQTPNEAWATSFVEELIRSRVTQFYICPGSRSTPMATALARAMRSHIGLIDCVSVHDERGAAFRALGYARATNRPAAVITSSGTAVANLYPAVVEAGLDGVPMILLTADRPYENRDTGTNQAVDQVKIFSETYIRWFRDIPPPSEEVAVSLALSDANHAVAVANELRGPVHVNIQFRENLAPESGPIRGDNRIGSITDFSSNRFTDVPGFQRWSTQGNKWSKLYSPTGSSIDSAVYDLAYLIMRSKRGMIVVGNLRSDSVEGGSSDVYSSSALISDFAEFIGFPIFAGAQSASLRFQSPAVVPFAEHLLKNPTIKSRMKPDLIIQIGSHLVSTEVQSLISATMKEDTKMAHVLLHTPRPGERADPGATVTHQILSDVEHLIPNLISHLKKVGADETFITTSALTPLVQLGKHVSINISDIIQEASREVIERKGKMMEEEILTEPMVILAMSEVLCALRGNKAAHLFLSNSMPVRDAEFFLYPSLTNLSSHDVNHNSNLLSVKVNRGASGIDGIISTATGFAEAASSPTTLLIGDLATLHDLNAFHNLSRQPIKTSFGQKNPNISVPLTSIIVNNDGGGIFSFLPIAKHGNDVNFDEFFGTPTNAFSFSTGAEAFGMPFYEASNYADFKASYEKALTLGKPSILEARVVGREQNVRVHGEITKKILSLIDDFLSPQSNDTEILSGTRLSAKVYSKNNITEHKYDGASKTMVLLHGWMGEKSEWEQSARTMIQDLPSFWNIISIDLPGHGEAPLLCTDERDVVKTAFSLDHRIAEKENLYTLEDIANSIVLTLRESYGIKYIDAIAGYSLGGRVALAMKKISSTTDSGFLSNDTKLFLLGSNPGIFYSSDIQDSLQRRLSDMALGDNMIRIYNRSHLSSGSSKASTKLHWISFVSNWYGNKSLWGNLASRNPSLFMKMVDARIMSLTKRAPDLALILSRCSVGRNPGNFWKFVNPRNAFFLSGQFDKKYSDIGRSWKAIANELTHYEIKNAGHALLTEAPKEVANFITKTLIGETGVSTMKSLHKSNDYEKSFTSLENKEVTLLAPCFTEVYPGLFDAEEFSINLIDDNGKGVTGVGWGDQSKATNKMKERRGFVISISSRDGSFIGLGEVSPLQGVHPETFQEVKQQVLLIKEIMGISDWESHVMNCEEVLTLNGSLKKYIDKMVSKLNKQSALSLTKLHLSVYSGFEMALMSLASHALRRPLPNSLLLSQSSSNLAPISMMIPINGLQTRKSTSRSMNNANSAESDQISYPSMKVKVGNKKIEDDIQEIYISQKKVGLHQRIRFRADANRSWSECDALKFAEALQRFDEDVVKHMEYLEEPIMKTSTENTWDISHQIEVLERWFEKTDIKYAIDESLADAVLGHKGDHDQLVKKLFQVLRSAKGCAAFVLKPTLLGFERSIQLSRLAHDKLGIGAVFTSTFDSGVGLAYTAFLASISDSYTNKDELKYPHGLSTFSVLSGDTLTPRFKSYVSNDGILNVASLGRAMFGLGIEEIRDYIYTSDELKDFDDSLVATSDEYQALSFTSDTGRKISVQVSLPLPFSDDVACSRFIDLPQQPRWSPWLKSVSYLEEGETQWTLNVRGIEYSWKAVSELIDNPKGIMWKSTSGIKNNGVVEFVKVSSASCLMTVKMTVITPRLINVMFKTTGDFFKEFLENRLLKWSLESFRDVVKADLALERGDVELGDALFGAVEGRSNAIEATLTYQGLKEKKL